MRYGLAVVLFAGSLGAQIFKPYNFSSFQSDVTKTTFAVVNASRIKVSSGIILPDNTVLVSTSGLGGSGGVGGSTFTYVEHSLFAGAATPDDVLPALVWKYNSVANSFTHAVYGIYYSTISYVTVSYDITVPVGYYGDGVTIYTVGTTTTSSTGNVGWRILISTVQTFGVTDTKYQDITIPAVNYASPNVLYKSTYNATSVFHADMAGREVKMVVMRDLSVSGLKNGVTLKKIILRFKVRTTE